MTWSLLSYRSSFPAIRSSVESPETSYDSGVLFRNEALEFTRIPPRVAVTDLQAATPARRAGEDEAEIDFFEHFTGLCRGLEQRHDQPRPDATSHA